MAYKLSEMPRDFARMAHEDAEHNMEIIIKAWGNPKLSEQEKKVLYILSLTAISNNVDSFLKRPHKPEIQPPNSTNAKKWPPP